MTVLAELVCQNIESCVQELMPRYLQCGRLPTTTVKLAQMVLRLPTEVIMESLKTQGMEKTLLVTNKMKCKQVCL